MGRPSARKIYPLTNKADKAAIHRYDVQRCRKQYRLSARENEVRRWICALTSYRVVQSRQSSDAEGWFLWPAYTFPD